MAKQRRDTSADLPAGIKDTGLSNLTRDLGSDAGPIVQRLAGDEEYRIAAVEALVALHQGKTPKLPKRSGKSMMDIKRVMGGRCFLRREVAKLYNMFDEEVDLGPILSARQISKLLKALELRCPIHEGRRVKETHVLVPIFPVICGRSFSLDWCLDSRMNHGTAVDSVGNRRAFIEDPFYGRVRKAEWMLVYWGPNDELGAPRVPEGYIRAELGLFLYTRFLLAKRGITRTEPSMHGEEFGYPLMRNKRGAHHVLVNRYCGNGLALRAEPTASHRRDSYAIYRSATSILSS